jgi:hypothetical protein
MLASTDAMADAKDAEIYSGNGLALIPGEVYIE